MRTSPDSFIEQLEDRALFSANLSATLLAVMPPTAIGSQKVKAGAVVTITNSGDEAAHGRTPVDLFLSLDHLFDESDSQIQTGAVKLSLAPGKSKAFRIKIRSFPDLPIGQYHLVARIDVDGSIPDSTPDDNVALDPNDHLQLAPPMRDLTAAFNTVPGFSPAGKPVKLLVDVGNIGNLPVTGRISFAIAASTDTTADPIGTPLAVATAKVKVPINDVTTIKLKFKIPSSFPAGTYFLVGNVDSTNVVAETDETNNPFPGFSTITIG